MTVWGAVTEVTDIIAPHDIPAVAVKVNEGSEAISEKLSSDGSSGNSDRVSGICI